MRIVYPCRVVEVERRSKVVRGWKNPDGTAGFETQELGWWVKIDMGYLLFYIGHDKPEVSVGQSVALALEFEDQP